MAGLVLPRHAHDLHDHMQRVARRDVVVTKSQRPGFRGTSHRTVPLCNHADGFLSFLRFGWHEPCLRQCGGISEMVGRIHLHERIDRDAGCRRVIFAHRRRSAAWAGQRRRTVAIVGRDRSAGDCDEISACFVTTQKGSNPSRFRQIPKRIVRRAASAKVSCMRPSA